MAIHWGILGTGFVARQFALSLKRVEGCILSAVASRNYQSAQQFSREIGGRALQSFEELIASSEVDVIYIATPTASHAQHTRTCLEAKKAVLCEKPLATSLQEARLAIDCARKNQVFLMEALWTRFLPIFKEVRGYIKEGKLGNIRLVQADLSMPVPDNPCDARTVPGPGSGALLDFGVYPISLALDLLGEPDTVQATVLRNAAGVDRQAALTLEYHGATAVLTTGFNGKGRNDAMIIGDQGSVQVGSPLYAPQTLTMTNWPMATGSGSGREMRRIDKLLERADWIHVAYRYILPSLRMLLGRDSAKFKPFMGFGYQFEAQEVVKQLNANNLESPVMSWSDSTALARIIDAARNRDNVQIRSAGQT